MPPATTSTTCRETCVELTKHSEMTVPPSPKQVHQETCSYGTSTRISVWASCRRPSYIQPRPLEPFSSFFFPAYRPWILQAPRPPWEPFPLSSFPVPCDLGGPARGQPRAPMSTKSSVPLPRTRGLPLSRGCQCRAGGAGGLRAGGVGVSGSRVWRRLRRPRDMPTMVCPLLACTQNYLPDMTSLKCLRILVGGSPGHSV
jgi:hypothetical protein